MPSTTFAPIGTPFPAVLPQPSPGPLQIEADFSNALGNEAFAEQHAANASAFVEQLGQLVAGLAPPTITPNFPVNPNAPAIAVPLAPAVQPITYDPPAIPAPFTGTLTVDDMFPDFTSQPPSLLFPIAPTANFDNVPSPPSVDFNYTYPTIDLTLPEAPDLLSISIQPFDGVTFPNFDETAPVLNLAAPQVYAYVADQPYVDDLLTGLKSFLLDRIMNGTGALPPNVEDGIWARAREKEMRQQAAALADLNRMEAMGYALPPGAYVDARIKIQTDTAATLAGSVRDQATENAKLAHDAVLKALDTATQIESRLIDYANTREQRNFEATKYATQAGVDVYNAMTKSFELRLEVYKSAITLYQAQLDAARTEVQVYQAQIEAEKLKVDIDNALVQQYKTRVDAAVATIQVFQGQIDLLKTRAQIENLKVSTYGEVVKAYVAEANVYQARVEGYKAAVSAEQTKQAAYATSAQAYTSLVEAKSKQVDATIAEFRALIEAKTQEYTAYKAQVDGAAENVKALAAANTAVADIYRATVQGTASYNDAMVKEWEAQITLSEKIAEIGVQAAQAQGQLYISTRSIAADAAKTAAQVEAQMAASALGTVTYSSHRSRQDSVSYSNSVGYSGSNSVSFQTSRQDTNYNYFEQQVLQHVTYSYNQANSTSYVHNIQSSE